MTTRKTIALTRWTFVGKVMSVLLNMLSRLAIAFLPRSKCLLIPWLQSPSAVTLEPKEIKYVTVPIVSPSICYEGTGMGAMILVFWMLSFKPTFSLSSFTFIKRLFRSFLVLFVSSLKKRLFQLFSPLSSVIRVVSSGYLRLLVFLVAILIPAWVTSSHTTNKERGQPHPSADNWIQVLRSTP